MTMRKPTRTVHRPAGNPAKDSEAGYKLGLRGHELDLLKETADAVSSQLDLDRLFQLVAERARELIQAETVLIPVVDSDCEHYTYRAGCGRNAAEILNETLSLEFGICGWVWRNNRPWWYGVLDDMGQEERSRWRHEASTVIMVPMKGKQHFLGGIAGMGKIGGERFTQRDMDLLSLFASQVAIAIENAHAFDKLEKAHNRAAEYQRELQSLNRELLSTNRDLETAALYDHLTGLPNRCLIQERMEQQLQISQRDRHPFSIVMIDLDRFKEVNDTLGHHVGDELLTQIGRRFTQMLRQSDTIGRLGGDEFAVILPGTDAGSARRVTRQLSAALDEPFSLKDATLTVDASMGIAAYPQHGNDVAELLRRADVAMYIAKRNREDCFIYDAKQDVHTLHRLSLMADLHQALNRDQVQLHYQPKLDLAGGTVVGVEALMRWNHPEHGAVAPDVFIPTLEQTGLIKRYTLWALETACAQRAAWDAAGYNLSMSVNLSMYNLRDTQLVEHIRGLQKKWGPPAGRLILEVTESAVMGDILHVSGIMDDLASIGVEFSIDDFGTGYSSLSHLKRLPVNELKIDRSFVMEMDQDPDDEIIIRSTIDLAHNMGLRVVAEGVESARTLDKLRKLGCDQAQGFHIARPASASAIARDLSIRPPG
jgi:diguanylate cyclase (GGDEF)-like protein